MRVVSFGGRMAHLMACAAKEIGFAPRALISLDPAPPMVDFPQNIRLTRLSMRESAVALLTLQLTTAARMTERDDKNEELQKSLPVEAASWPEGELVIRVADRLVQEGLREFTAEEVIRVGRQVEAWAENQSLLANCLAAQGSAQLPKTQWVTFLVLASEREQFFEKQPNMGIGKSTAGRPAARAYGSIESEMELEGKHLVVCQRCAEGEDEAFVHAMQVFLRESDVERSARWRLNTLVRTPVLLFEASSAHIQGRATSIMQNGPPITEKRLSTIVLFVLSNERSGSSLLQLCLQVHSSFYAGQELYLLPFSTVDERGILLPFEMSEVCADVASLAHSDLID